MSVGTDNRLSDCPMVPVRCRRCGANMLARKSSWNQTSVQWDAGASAQCLDRCEPTDAGTYSGRGVFLACSSLTDSIVHAVRQGEMPVIDEMTSPAT